MKTKHFSIIPAAPGLIRHLTAGLFLAWFGLGLAIETPIDPPAPSTPVNASDSTEPDRETQRAPKPFEARYRVSEDGDEMGESVVRLFRDQNHWRLDSVVRGTHGLASLLGFKRTESTLFDWRYQPPDDLWLPLSYRFSQKVAFKKKTSQFQYDPKTGIAHGKSGSRSWQLPIKPPFITPNLVVLTLARDLCDGQQDIHYRVLDKGKVKDYHFTVVGTEKGLIKVTKEHGSPERVTESWHDPRRQCLNVRSRHKEPGDDWLETVLVSTSLRPEATR